MNSERPQKGDMIQSVDIHDLTGVVFDTHYQNGEGGFHAMFTRDGKSWPSWGHCDRYRVIERAAPMPAKEES